MKRRLDPLPARQARAATLRRRALPLLVAAAALVLALIGFAGGNLLNSLNNPTGPTSSDEPEVSASSAVIIGPAGGEVLTASPSATVSPTATATPSSTPVTPTPTPTAAPTAATPQPTPAATFAPTTAPTPAPTATPVILAALAADETIELWYQYVEDEQFDEAYDMWTERMKDDYHPRSPNLDHRWRDTLDIAIEEISIAEQTPTTARVQIEFVETKENGESRRFIGWWDLVWSSDGWLLDHPNF